MKKLTALILAFAMIFSLCACGGEEPAASDKTQATETPVAAPAETPASTTTSVPAETQTPQEPVMSTEEKAKAYMDIYKDLLCDAREFVIGEDIAGFEEGASYLLSDFAEEYRESVDVEWGGTHESLISYGYLDCGSDGIPELSVELALEDTENYETIMRYFVIRCDEGTPVMVGDYDYYYRSYSSINEAGVIENSGSSGAASYYYDYSYLNADGEELFLYSCSTEMANPKPAIPSYFLPSAIDDDYYDMYGYDDVEQYYSVEVYNFTNIDIDDPDYDAAFEEYCANYFFTITDEYGNDVDPAEEYASLYEENGVKIVTWDEAEQMLKEHREELGVSDDILTAPYVEYRKLDIDQLNDEVIENEDGSITVGCTANFIENIADGATIYLKPGVYNLTDWLHVYTNEYSYSYNICRVYPYADFYSKHIFTAGEQLIVNRVNDLTIASLDPEDPAEIVIDDAFSLVMSFCECSDLTINDIVAGHTTGNEGHCSADVFEFNECDRVTLNDCDLYGCGCYGIMTRQTAGLDVNGGKIRDCTSGMAEFYGTTQIVFTGTTFENCYNTWGSMFYLIESSADFYGCTFKNLGDVFSLDSSHVWLSDCTMDDAAIESVVNNAEYNNSLYMY